MPTINDELTRLGAALRTAADDRGDDREAIWLRPPHSSRKNSRLVWAVAATVGTLLAFGAPAMLRTFSNTPTNTAASTTAPVTPTTTIPTEALPEQGPWYALEAPGWTLADAIIDQDNGSVHLRYTSEREGVRHPDRVFLVITADGEPGQDLEVFLELGPEIEGRVDGFGNPWETPVDRMVSVGERQVRVVSFTDYQHIALWVDQGVGLELNTERATFDQLLDLIESVVPVTPDEWEAITSQ